MGDTKDDPNLRFWKAIHVALSKTEKLLPFGEDPREIGYDHPDELWKNEAELQYHEEELKDDIHSCITDFCDSKKWSKDAKPEVYFLVAKRLEWAKDFIHVFTIPSKRIGGSAIFRSENNGLDVIHWLLTDAYENKYPPEPHFPMVMIQE